MAASGRWARLVFMILGFMLVDPLAPEIEDRHRSGKTG
jgi:hypothetical protein